MSKIEAGFGRVEITPDHVGFQMLGYGNREGLSAGIHDPLCAQALVLRQGEDAWALCAVDVLAVNAEVVADIRQQVSHSTGLMPQAIMIAAIHTHSAPSPLDKGNWEHPFAALVTDAIIQAWDTLRPAQLGVGAGFLYGYSINRRWLERPIDPGVGVLRVEDAEGHLLGTVVNFGLHAVVMGYDNLEISADYVGYARDKVEQSLGGRCVFTNGGAANVNPITATVRRQLAERREFSTMTGAYYYGSSTDAVPIEDRGGGTFAEAEEIGHAVADEIVYVAQGIETHAPQAPIWSAQAWVDHLNDGTEIIETQALGVDRFALVGQPGEVFVETALDLTEKLRLSGHEFPWVISYANDWRAYLAPASAFAEGGYEVERAQEAGHSPHLQDRLWSSLSAAIPPLRKVGGV